MRRWWLLFLLALVWGCSSAPPETPALPTLAVLPSVTPTQQDTTTPLPEVVGVPTPTPIADSLGTFIGRLSSGDIRISTFTTASQRQVYTFEETAGQYVTIDVIRLSGNVDPLVTLYSPSGNPLATDDNSGGNRAARLRNIPLPEDGVYLIQASGKGFQGDYRISLTSGDQPEPVTPVAINPLPTPTQIRETLTPIVPTSVSGNRLEDHVPVMGALTHEGDFNRFPIFAASGEVLTIGASPLPDNPFLLRLEVYGPAGDLVAAANSSSSKASGDALISPLRVESTGAYVVFVTAEDRKSVGQFIISYGTGSTRENVMRGTASADLLNPGEIGKRGLRDVWSLVLHQGDVISAAVTPDPDSDFDPIVELVAADGSLVAIDDNSGGNRSALIAEAEIPVSGLYHLQVRAAQAASIGKYTLIWHYVNLAPTSTPPPSTVLLMTIDDFVPDNTYLFYPFYGQKGQHIDIEVVAQPGTTFDPVAALLDPDGKVIAQGDDGDNGSLNPHFSAVLPADGTYSVRVNGYIKGGAFELTVQAIY